MNFQRQSIRYQRSQSLRSASRPAPTSQNRRQFLPQKSLFFTQAEIPTPAATDRGHETDKPDSSPHLGQTHNKGIFHYIHRVNLKDDEPDLGQMSPVKGHFVLTEGQFGNLPPNRGIATDRASYRSRVSLKQSRSLSELGPNDVEITYSDIEKQIKPTPGLKPLQKHKRRLHGDPDTSSVSSNAPFVLGEGSQSGRDDRGIKGLSRADSGTSTPVVSGNIFLNTLGDETVLEDKMYATVIDGSKMFMERKQNRMRPASATAGDVEDSSSSLDIQRNYSEDQLNRKHVGKRNQENKSAFHREKVEVKKKTLGEKIAITLGVIVSVIVVYGVFPVCLYFGAYNYDSDKLRIVMNFGLVGFLLGIFQVMLLYKLIDTQMLNKFKELENKIQNIDPMNYLVISKCSAFNLVSFSVGAHILAGLAIENTDGKTTGTKIVLTSIGTIIVQGILWVVVHRLKPPRAVKKKQEILEKDLKQINKARKDFMADLYDTKHKMDMQISVADSDTKRSVLSKETPKAPMGVQSSAACAVNLDGKKVNHSNSDVAPDFKRMRNASRRTFMITFLLLVQLLILIQIIKLTEEQDNTVLALLCVAFLIVVGSIFGLVDLFVPFSEPVIHTMKLISIIVTAVAFRFQLMGMESRDMMIGAVILNIVYKVILYCFGGVYEEKIIKQAREKRKRSIRIDFYDSIHEREASSLKHPLYLFQKFALVQEVEMFCSAASLFVNIDKGWLGNITSNPSLGIDGDWFYLYFVIIEILINILLSAGFISATKKVLSTKVLVTNVDLGQEFIKVLKNNAWAILSIKNLVLFILLFSSFNEL